MKAFNNDPEWQTFVLSLEPVIVRIAQKYSSSDAAMRQDIEQEARIALYGVRPEQITGPRDAYARNVIRNAMLSYLHSFLTGPWDSGRTVWRIDPTTRVNTKHYVGPRLASYDQLSDDLGLQVDQEGAVSWLKRDDGLEDEQSAYTTEQGTRGSNGEPREQGSSPERVGRKAKRHAKKRTRGGISWARAHPPSFPFSAIAHP